MSRAPHYVPVPAWPRTPDEFAFAEAADVATDSAGNVHVLTRGPGRINVYTPGGEFVTAWGEGLFTDRTHGITITESDDVFVVDDAAHRVYRFGLEGQLSLTLGSGQPSETGYRHELGMSSIVAGGPPFNRPTKVAVGDDGTIFVADGYGNARIHVFSASGEFVRSWGGPGIGPGEFNLPHSLCILGDTVLVADRENDRLQIFDLSGRYLDEWTHVQRPLAVHVDAEDRVYVSELGWANGEKSLVGSGSRVATPRRFASPPGVRVLDRFGNVLLHWASTDASRPGNVLAPHGLTTDIQGDMYIAEVPCSYWRRRGQPSGPLVTLQKWASRLD